MVSTSLRYYDWLIVDVAGAVVGQGRPSSGSVVAGVGGVDASVTSSSADLQLRSLLRDEFIIGYVLTMLFHAVAHLKGK